MVNDTESNLYLLGQDAEIIVDSEDSSEVAFDGDKPDLPSNKQMRDYVLRCFEQGISLSINEIIECVIALWGISEDEIHAMGRANIESRIKFTVWRLCKNEHLLDIVEPHRYALTEKGVDECMKRGFFRLKYGKDEFLQDIYMSEKRYDRLLRVLKSRKNVILQGAPGVGKTFCARRLAWSVMGERDDDRIEMVQFHQSYGYEDFIMGYKPDGEGFSIREGVFYRFCKKAADDPEQRDHFFIIDEINRANLSKVFGELLMLIECDHRGESLRLAYRDEEFSVPPNLYIIGMMNTADRSLALIDYALRRRFSFFEMEPAFESKGFRTYQERLGDEVFDRLVRQLIALNEAIAADSSLGRGFRIGHSYLCGAETADVEWLEDVVELDIIPTLEEYWFDDEDTLGDWKDALREALS